MDSRARQRRSSVESRQPLKRLRFNKNSAEPLVSQESDKSKDVYIAEIRRKLQEFVIAADNNKLRENVWGNDAIDLFFKFSCSNADPDYRSAGTWLSAVVKLYSLRIDSLYSDVTRFSSLFRSKDKRRPRKEDNDNDQQQNTDDEPPRKIRRRNVRKSAMIASPESLNGKLITIAAVDPFFSKLNTFIGSTRANRMLQNIITPKNSSLKVTSNDRFWNSRDQKDSSNFLEQRRLLELSLVDPESLQFKVIRSTLAEYRITSEVLDEHHVSTYINLCESDVEMNSDNAEAVDSLFYHEFERKIAGKANSSLACLTSQDSGYVTQGSAISRTISGSSTRQGESEDELEAHREFVEDLEPLDGKQLEYSYRPSDVIKNFYAGPCYWKFLQPARKRVQSKRKMKRVSDKVTIASLQSFDFKHSSLVRGDLPTKAATKKWSREALKLPRNFHLQPELSDGFDHSSLCFDDPFEQLEEENDFQEVAEHFNDYNQSVSSEPMPLSTSIYRRSQNQPPVNMKSIRRTSMLVIENEACITQSSTVSFSAVHLKVDKLMSQEAEKSSCALTFLSLLQAASEKKIELKHGETIDDFSIIMKS